MAWLDLLSGWKPIQQEAAWQHYPPHEMVLGPALRQIMNDDDPLFLPQFLFNLFPLFLRKVVSYCHEAYALNK